jgi:hypothetical protein
MWFDSVLSIRIHVSTHCYSPPIIYSRNIL